MKLDSSINNQTAENDFRKKIFSTVREFYRNKYSPQRFVPGVTPIPPSGKVFDEFELINLVDSSLDFHLTADRFSRSFEKRLSHWLKIPYIRLTNSGSSANLLAVSVLTAEVLAEKRLQPGDEVISTAVSFPTTINPILQNNLIPVFVDVDIPTYNVMAQQIEKAISKKTKAIILAHTLGNPFDIKTVVEIAEKYKLWLIEDCCDALGSKYDGKFVSSFGDMATFSFYPAHHITMGEGGAVATDHRGLKSLIESYRDWGRDCWCSPGKDNTCGKRFDWQLGDLPYGYDHKYTYSNPGYNLKVTDMQAAIGLAQLDKLESFISARRRNFEDLKLGLKPFENFLILPEATVGSEPSWFGFLLTIRPDAPFKREKLTEFLNKNRIGTRLLFSGNILRQPYFKNRPHRVIDSLTNSDRVMHDTFWIGVFPGITSEMISYVISKFEDFFSGY